MYRDIENQLLSWKNQPGRMPLLLRGARQVGKTYVVTKFAEEHFKQLFCINFELQPEYIDCFNDLSPSAIINAINTISRQTIVPGETLLFLDEIQECPSTTSCNLTPQ